MTFLFPLPRRYIQKEYNTTLFKEFKICQTFFDIFQKVSRNFLIKNLWLILSNVYPVIIVNHVVLMMAITSQWDWPTVVVAVMVFALPLTLLIPDFSMWDVVPKFKVTRFHILSQHLTWPQLNGVAIGLLGILFCIYLEIRKRKLDDMVEDVLRVSQATDVTMESERVRQAAVMRACVELLDASAEHYEHLALLRDELRKREEPRMLQRPPSIEPSTSNSNL